MTRVWKVKSDWNEVLVIASTAIEAAKTALAANLEKSPGINRDVVEPTGVSLMGELFLTDRQRTRLV